MALVGEIGIFKLKKKLPDNCNRKSLSLDYIINNETDSASAHVAKMLKSIFKVNEIQATNSSLSFGGSFFRKVNAFVIFL